MKKKRFKIEAKGKKNSSSDIPFLFRFLSWGSLAIIFGTALWFWSPGWESAPLISEHEKKLRELSRENPDAEVFEIQNEKKTH